MRFLGYFRYFCCSRSRGSILVLIHKFCTHIWQKETDIKLISTEYKGLILGSKLLEILDRNNASANYQVLTLRLMVNDFGLNLLKYDTWNTELPLCECGEYDTKEHLVFYCQLINRCAFKKFCTEEEIPSSLVALINCKKDKVIRAFIDLLKVNESILDSCDTSWKTTPIHV